MMNGTLRSWVHYIELRSANGTQKEHMEVAQKCAIEIANLPTHGETIMEKYIRTRIEQLQ